MFFGAPNPLHVLEHLASTIELQTLQDIFNDCIQQYRDQAKKFTWAPAELPQDIRENMICLGAENHTDVLYGKKCEY